MAKKTSVYVGMALSDAPEKFRVSFQNELKTALKANFDMQLLDFVGLEKGDERSVYTYDRDCAMEADLCIFICDYASTGMGIEIALRLAAKKPMLCFAETQSKVTRMLLGLCEVEGVPFHRYDNVSNILYAVEPWLKKAA